MDPANQISFDPNNPQVAGWKDGETYKITFTQTSPGKGEIISTEIVSPQTEEVTSEDLSKDKNPAVARLMGGGMME